MPSSLGLRALALLAAGLSASAAGAPLGHDLVLRPEHGEEGFPYLFHRPTGRWVGRECQLRVQASRPLPEPLQPAQRESPLAIVLFGRLTAEPLQPSGGIGNAQRHAQWVWWWLAQAVGDVELKGNARIGVQVSWPGHGDAAAEAMEVFELPAIDALPPETWSPWRPPDRYQVGRDAWHAEAHRRPAAIEAPVAKLPPFELRCRAGLWRTPFRRRLD